MVLSLLSFALSAHSLGAQKKAITFKGKSIVFTDEVEVPEDGIEERLLSDTGELFPEICEGFRYKVQGESLRISKSGKGSLDTSVTKDGEIAIFRIPFPGERKSQASFKFLKKEDGWNIQSAGYVELNWKKVKLLIFDVNSNGRFDDRGIDLIRGVDDEDIPLRGVIQSKSLNGLFHVWGSGVSAVYQEVLKSVPIKFVECVGVINSFRGRGGLRPLSFNLSLFEGLKKHVGYVFLNKSFDSDLPESAVNPGYTPEGARASNKCKFLAHTSELDPIESVLRDMRNPGIIFDVINPGLASTAFYSEFREKHFMMVYNLEFDVAGEPRNIIQYPFPGQVDVRVKGLLSKQYDVPGSNGGRLFGHPILLRFPRKSTPRNVSAYLKDEEGREVPFRLTTPEAPFDSDWSSNNKNTIILFPRDLLETCCWHEVGISWSRTRGRMEKKVWRFRTAPD